MALLRFAEYLDVDLDTERWRCHDCGHDLGDARGDYKRGLLVAERDPAEIHPKRLDGEYTFAPDGDWIRIIEFYCPSCGRQVESEYLPPGHPLTRDTELDVDSLKQRLASGEAHINDEGKLQVAR
ncbi:acetone carboxylase subunit gamma [Mycobacterium sp. OAE908]|uniref:acetone carboxylase subunit gamma n=1 Tax=Mycobacterium sp. OAE908 TaxID=2817899 RepID=UPI001AEB0874